MAVCGLSGRPITMRQHQAPRQAEATHRNVVKMSGGVSISAPSTALPSTTGPQFRGYIVNCDPNASGDAYRDEREPHFETD
jgi:hypothetical protein